MTDFVKVNYIKGMSALIPKKDIHLEMGEKCCAYSSGLAMALIPFLLQAPEAEKGQYWASFYLMWEITREEYDRLCKELGVKDAV